MAIGGSANDAAARKTTCTVQRSQWKLRRSASFARVACTASKKRGMELRENWLIALTVPLLRAGAAGEKKTAVI